MTLKSMGAPLIICLLMLTVGCATVYDVSYDYKSDFDFNALKTYDWTRVPEKEGMENIYVVSIVDAVDDGLQAKGLIQMPDNPDFRVALYIETEEQIDVNRPGYYRSPGYYGYHGYAPYHGYRRYGPYRMYRGYGPYPGYRRYPRYWGYHGYAPYSGFRRYDPYPYYDHRYGGVTVNQYEEATIILDFIDPGLNEVIWQGAARSAIDDSMATEKRRQLMDDIVRKILENFPPTS